MIYRETSTRIEFSLVDDTAKEDAAFDARQSPVQDGCDLDKLKDDITINNYLTNEHNYSILDESLTDINSFSDYAFISSFASNNDRTFDNDYYFRIIFDDFHTSNGITITFDNDFLPDKIKVEYYDSTENNHTLIYANTYTVDENVFFCNSAGTVENYKEIRIHFISTKSPNSIIKMSKIEFGVDYVWGDGGAKQASLINAEIFEETDIISNTLSIDTCKFTVYSEDDDFNIDNPNNIYTSIKKYQALDVYEIIRAYDNDVPLPPQKIFMGRYYVKSWSATEKHSITFECVDLIGLLDDVKCENFKVTTTFTFGMAIQEIIDFLDMGDIIDYPPELYSIPLIGLFPFCTCREALQILCFAIGAYATCSRSDKIHIYVPTKTISSNIGNERNFGVINSKLNPLVTGVQYPIIGYSRKAQKEIICEVDVDVGSNKTVLIPDKYVYWGVGDEPYRKNTSTANFTIDNSCQNMLHKLVLNVTTAGKAIIEGYTYDIDKKLFTKKKENFNGEPNIIDISKIDVYRQSGNVYQNNPIPDRLLPYYDIRNSCEYEFLLNNEKSGDWCLFKNMYGEDILGNIFNMTIDLTGGFIAKTKLVLCENLSPLIYTYVCDNELISGDDIGII